MNQAMRRSARGLGLLGTVLLLLTAILGLLGQSVSLAAALTPEIQKAVRANTFEVVLKKPVADPLSYEKPLPLDLLPYSERTDAYNSVGTAFALGNNRYVTAAHVIQTGIASQFGAPMLRRSDGAVFEIDQIIKYSHHQDFVLFSLKNGPSVTGLAVNESPQVDDVVLAVGNALGQGIVIRDGLYTSSTPEDQDGRWKWIRFSAAASPGNSGGPLLDDSGRVIGVVLAKSPNENLNYSLPITHVLTTPQNKALLEGRTTTRLPYLRGTQTYNLKDGFDLPLSWKDFERTLLTVMNKHERAAQDALLQANADTIFPKGPGTESVLYDPKANDFEPRLIIQQQDGSWVAEAPRYSSADLPGDGSVAFASVNGVTLLRVVRPDAATDPGFYSDSKQVMDWLLKALDLRRNVGPDRVRITSLGAAQSDTVHTDTYGRTWQQRVYAVPYLNAYVGCWMLPTPDGYVGIMQIFPPVQRELISERAMRAADLFDVSLTGTIAQWRAYLARRNSLPKALESLRLDTGKSWAVHTPRFQFNAPAELIGLTDASVLKLTMGFFPQGTQTQWGIQGVKWAPDVTSKISFGLERRMRPPGKAKQALRTLYDDMRNRRAPYGDTPDHNSSSTWRLVHPLSVPATQAGQTASDLLYAVSLQADTPSRFALITLVTGQMAAAVSILEKGQADAGQAAEAAQTAPSTPAIPSSAAAAFEVLAKSVLTSLESNPDPDLTDTRPKKFADDVHELLAITRLAFQVTGADADTLMKSMMFQVKPLAEYWRTVRPVQSNRDIWSAFLARNKLPPSTPHGPAVQAAEKALADAQAKSTLPESNWVALSHQLSQAYVQERLALHQEHPLADAEYRQRNAACLPPATTTASGPRPTVGPVQPDSLEYYPPEDRKKGLEAAVVISVKVSPTGCAERLAIAGSSGSEAMDEAALRYAETVRFLPGVQDGKPIAGQLVFRVRFALRD